MDYTTYTSILSIDENYEISALLQPDGNYSMVSFTIKSIEEFAGEEESWDNEDYLINILYPHLKDPTHKADEAAIDSVDKEAAAFEQVMKDREMIIPMFEEAIRVGFFRENFREIYKLTLFRDTDHRETRIHYFSDHKEAMGWSDRFFPNASIDAIKTYVNSDGLVFELNALGKIQEGILEDQKSDEQRLDDIKKKLSAEDWLFLKNKLK